MPFRIAVLASGRGSNLRALIDACTRGALTARVVGVFSDRPGCGALAIAAEADIPVFAIQPRDYAERSAFDAALFDAALAVQPNLIVCAGYMRIIAAEQVGRVLGRMINIHPSLLPRYPGLHTHQRALAAGDSEHGASVHYVIPALDAGPVIAQARVPVLPSDTPDILAQRVLAREHPLLCASVDLIVRGELGLRDQQVLYQGTALAAPLLLLGNDDRLHPGASA